MHVDSDVKMVKTSDYIKSKPKVFMLFLALIICHVENSMITMETCQSTTAFPELISSGMWMDVLEYRIWTALSGASFKQL